MIVEHPSTVPARTQSTSAAFNIAQAIEEHLPLVQKVARTAYYRYGRHFEHDDLVGYGHLGLVIAANKYAGLQFSLRQAIDFTVYAHKRIWRSIEVGRDRMATIGRWHYRKIKRGQMPKPRFMHDTEAFCLSEALADGWDEPETTHSEADAMTAWLRKQNPLWARVVELHVNQGFTHERVGELIGRSASAVSSMCRRAINLMRWKYNENAYRHDDRTARRRASMLLSA